MESCSGFCYHTNFTIKTLIILNITLFSSKDLRTNYKEMKLGFFTVAMIAAISGFFESAEALRLDKDIVIAQNLAPKVEDDSVAKKNAARSQIEKAVKDLRTQHSAIEKTLN